MTILVSIWVEVSVLEDVRTLYGAIAANEVVHVNCSSSAGVGYVPFDKMVETAGVARTTNGRSVETIVTVIVTD